MKPTSRPFQFSRVTAALVFTLFAIMMTSTLVLAGDREDAAKEFDLGQQSEKAGNFASALDHYLRSYELIPHAATAYNIASNYEKIGKPRQAAQYFNSYLEQDPQANDKDKVRKKIADLQNLPARVVVRSSPPGAQITVDGGPQAREPIVLSLKGGDHEVVATLQGQTQTQRVSAQFGEPQEIVVTFGASTAIINVWSTASNTTVSVDGAVVGIAPLAVTVPAGPHQVTGSAPGFVPQTKPVVAQAGRAEQISFSLTAANRLNRTGNALGASATMKPEESRIRFVFGMDGGSTTVGKGTGGSFMLHSGIRTSTIEFYATFGSFSKLDNVAVREPGETELVGGGVVFGLGLRRASFAGRGLRFSYATNLLFNTKVAFDARLGLVYHNLLNGGIKSDLYAEVGLGLVGRASVEGATSLYVPVTFGLMFHR